MIKCSPNMRNLRALRHNLDAMATAGKPIDARGARYLAVTVESIDRGIADIQRRHSPAYDASFEVIRHLWIRAKRDRDDEAQDGASAAASFLWMCLFGLMEKNDRTR